MQKFRHFLTRIPTKIVRPRQFTSACALVGEPGAVCRSQIKSFRFRFKSFKYNYVVVFSLIESVPSRLMLTDGRIKSFLVIFWSPRVHLQSSQVISRHLNVQSQSFLVKQCLFAVIHVPFTVVYSQVCNKKSIKILPWSFRCGLLLRGPFLRLTLAISGQLYLVAIIKTYLVNDSLDSCPRNACKLRRVEDLRNEICPNCQRHLQIQRQRDAPSLRFGFCSPGFLSLKMAWSSGT